MSGTVAVISGLSAIFSTLALAAVAAGLGGALLVLAAARRNGRWAEDRSGTAATAVLSGVVLLFLVLLALDGLGIPWQRRTLAAACGTAFALLAGAAFLRWRTGGEGRVGLRLPDAVGTPGWGDLLAAVALAVVAWGAWTRRISIPDFIYHWGIKGKRFHWAGGIDAAYLGDPLLPVQHPDYPLLLPSLYGATAQLRGFFDERSMLLWSVLFLALLVAFARSALLRGGVRGLWLQGGVALVAMVVAMFAVGYDLAGGGDPLLALALVAALPALVGSTGPAGRDGPPRRRPEEWLAELHRDDLRLGMAAALAAGAKIEGVPLAGFLLLARLLVTAPVAGGHRGAARVWAVMGGLLRRMPRLVLPGVAVVVPWMVLAVRHDLFTARTAGGLDLEHLPEVLEASLAVLALPEWHAFPWLLLLLPWLLLSRRLWAGAAVVAAQAGFYLYVYLSTPVEPTFYVLSSLPRLVFHLLPAVLVLLVLRLAPPSPESPAP